MPRYVLSPRLRAAALGLLATAAAVPFIVAPQIPAAAATARAGTGFGRAIQIAQPTNAARPGSTSGSNDSILIGVACSGRGYCSAGGSYTDKSGNGQAMVVTESRGKWARAVEVKLPRNAASEPNAEVNGVACTSPGNCVAVGYYQPKPGDSGDFGFIVTQRHGTWGRAIAATPLPKGTTASGLYAVACPAPGSCEAIGYYLGHTSAIAGGLVLIQVRGRWTQDRTLRPPVGEAPDLSGIACTRPGYCVADGFYYPTASYNVYDAVGYVQSRGKWGGAVKIRAPKNETGTEAGLDSAACVPHGSCLGAGGYAAGTSGYPMAAQESAGKWRAATQVRALPAHGTGAYLDGVSCASSKLCVGTGGYSTNPKNLLAYLVTDLSGRWKDAGGVSLPANAFSPARSFFYAVGCASDGYCAAVGDYAYDVTTNFDYAYPMVATRS
jgi:hypothetical protein